MTEFTECGELVPSEFHPPWWAKNRHVQTIWPRFLQSRLKITSVMQRLPLPDGDFIDLAWSPEPANSRGIVVIFHGLEGSIKSHYANDMMAVLYQQGWHVVLMHFRGCSGTPNLTPRMYHSGDTQDALYFLSWLEEQFPEQQKLAIGFSLGANMLLKLLGENPDQRILRAAVAISAPFLLAECSESINKGFSRVYQTYLLKSMVKNFSEKMSRMANDKVIEALNLSKDTLKKLSNFRDFDDLITAPLHGFANAEEYYRKCSARGFLRNILTPTLVLHAKDDPFMNASIVPTREELAPAVRLELSERGGHVGFMQGPPWKPKVWLHQRVSQFFNDLNLNKNK